MGIVLFLGESVVDEAVVGGKGWCLGWVGRGAIRLGLSIDVRQSARDGMTLWRTLRRDRGHVMASMAGRGLSGSAYFS